MPLSAPESKVCRAIEARRAALLADLAHLVSIPTGHNHKPGLDQTRETLTRRLAAIGATVSLIPGAPKEPWLSGSDEAASIPPTAVCRRPHAAGKKLLLCGHLDTVHDPRGPFRELAISPDQGSATGPGCVDMKGGLVIALGALEALEECGVACSWGFILNSDEETGSYHSDAALRAEAALYDAGLVLESALPDGSLVVERPGSGQFHIEVRGKAAHVGREFTSGVSAITAIARCALDVAALADPPRGLIANIGVIRGGTATNVVPDAAGAWGNVRFPAGPAAEELARKLDALATPPDAGLPSVTVRRSFNRPAKPMTPAVEHLALTARRAAEDLSQKLPFGKTGGVCDGNNLQAAGLPTIDTLGVRGGGLHTPQEWIEIASLVERCRLLAVLMMRLSAGS